MGTLATLVFALPASAVDGAVAARARKSRSREAPRESRTASSPRSAVSRRASASPAATTRRRRGVTEGLIVSETNGVWRTPISLVPPVGAGANPDVTIYDVSCGGAGNCAAVGSYSTARGTSCPSPRTRSAAGGIAPRARRCPRTHSSMARPVNCATSTALSANNCSAVGEYFDNYRAYPRSQGFVATEVRGHWSRASEVTMAQGRTSTPS